MYSAAAILLSISGIRNNEFILHTTVIDFVLTLLCNQNVNLLQLNKPCAFELSGILN